MIHKNHRPVWETPESEFLMKALMFCGDRRHCSCKYHCWRVHVNISPSADAIYQPGARLSRHPFHTAAACVQLPKSTCFQGSRKEEVSVISQRTRDLFQYATWAWVEHVFIFTVRYEGLGTCHPAVSLWAPKFHSTQPQLRSTRHCLIPFINPTWQITVLYIVWSPSAAMILYSTPLLSLTALCYVCSEKVMICIDHC